MVREGRRRLILLRSRYLAGAAGACLSGRTFR